MNDLTTTVRPFPASLLRNPLLLALACATSLACSDDEPTYTERAPEATSTGPADADAGTHPLPPDAGNDAALDGVWRERGYARLMHITDGAAVEYHITSVSCTAAGEYSLDELLGYYDRIDVGNDKLAWYQRDHFTRHDFDRLESLPATCTDRAEPNAQRTYEAFWRIFEENYAFFDLRQVDWDATREAHAGELNDSSSDEDLMTALSLSIEPLNDGHVYVFDGVSQGFMSGSLGGLWDRWAAQYEGEPVTNPINPRGDFTLDMQTHVERDILGGQGTSAIHGLMTWGWLEADIGYVDLHEFYYPFEEEPSIAEIHDMVDEAMLEMTTELADAKALVVDIRFNQGGSDSMGYAIASWLTEEPVLVARKRAVYEGDWTPLQDVYVEPRDTVFFDKPIALLQSENSISAAETFAMAMNELPQVTSVGTHTYGVLSDVLQRVLPNGWIVALSNEVYEAPNGSVYEATGVPVDVEVPYDEALSYYENLDATVDRAVEVLRSELGK